MIAQTQVSRRGVLRCAMCGALAAPGLFAAAPVLAQANGREVVREFGYADVQLTGGPLKRHYDQIHAHYLSLDNDRLLKGFRQHAGLPAPGKDMGGWYDPSGFVPAGTFGQYVSGLARFGASTGDRACHAKVAELVKGFATALERNANPFVGPKAEQVWPAYILDKYHVGLIDAYRLSGVEQARELLPAVLRGGLPYVSPVSRDRIGKKDPPYDETYVLPENLFAAYEVTGDKRFHDLALHYLLDKDFFDPLARGEDVLPTKHAYSHAIALSSAAAAYLNTGNPKYKAALKNAWRFMELQRYASGGMGPEEQFVEPHHGKLFASLTSTTAHFETPCGSYADMKLARYLLRLTGDGRYGDGLERTLYNTVLAVRPPDSDGDYPYYSNYGPQAQKVFYQSKWPCCSGTLAQGVADYVLNLYFHDADGIYVNMFAPSTVRWRRPGGVVSLVQQTDYPAGDTTRIRVQTPSPSEFALRIRIPAWIAGPATIRINGQPVQAPVRSGFAEIRRRWRDGDVVEATLPQAFRVVPIDDSRPDVVAVMRGPVMYVGLDPWPELASTRLQLPSGLQPVGGEAEVFHQTVSGKDLVFVPYHRTQNDAYNTYFLKA